MIKNLKKSFDRQNLKLLTDEPAKLVIKKVSKHSYRVSYKNKAGDDVIKIKIDQAVIVLDLLKKSTKEHNKLKQEAKL